MKKLVLFCAAFICAAVTVQAADDLQPFQIARAVKLGRSINATNSPQSMINSQTTARPPELMEKCDANCEDCDGFTGTCLLCAADRYISGKLCLACPEKNYCDGQTAVPNCTGVSCMTGAFAEATDTGCCCVSNCSGVSCAAGYSPVANATGCCCV